MESTKILLYEEKIQVLETELSMYILIGWREIYLNGIGSSAIIIKQ